VIHLGDELEDFADTAAVVSLLDLVVSADTATVHLAGALGRPVWVLLPFSSDFRWLLEREDSPWYPTARLFRQPRLGDWDSVLARVQEELGRLALSLAH
jgi:ADP-heptose:LPS heptosyltransferase